MNCNIFGANEDDLHDRSNKSASCRDKKTHSPTTSADAYQKTVKLSIRLQKPAQWTMTLTALRKAAM